MRCIGFNYAVIIVTYLTVELTFSRTSTSTMTCIFLLCEPATVKEIIVIFVMYRKPNLKF